MSGGLAHTNLPEHWDIIFSMDTNRPLNTRRETVVRPIIDIAWFLTVTSLWVVGLTLLFLAIDWPRIVYYALVIVGTLVFASRIRIVR